MKKTSKETFHTILFVSLFVGAIAVTMVVLDHFGYK